MALLNKILEVVARFAGGSASSEQHSSRTSSPPATPQASAAPLPYTNPFERIAQRNLRPPPMEATTVEPPSHAVPVYPPADEGIHLHDPNSIVQSQEKLILRIRLGASVNDESFERMYMEPIRLLARTIHLLPASEEGNHTGAGGLFRLALEMSFHALQQSESTLFAADHPLEIRRELEPRWRYATWLAGLCCELYRPVTSLVVLDREGAKWPMYEATLYDWLTQRGSDRYFVQWVANAGREAGAGAAVTLAQMIIPRGSLQYLHEGSNEIIPTIFDVITGRQSSGVLPRLIDAVRDLVAKRDTAVNPKYYGKQRVGAHLEPHLISAMRTLILNGVWTINQKKSRLWLSNEGLFLVWKTAAEEMLKHLKDSGVAGVPNDARTLLELLCAANVFELGSDGNPYWEIYPAGRQLVAVRFREEETIFGVLDEIPERVESVLKASSVIAVGATEAEDSTPVTDGIGGADKPCDGGARSADAPSAEMAPPAGTSAQSESQPQQAAAEQGRAGQDKAGERGIASAQPSPQHRTTPTQNMAPTQQPTPVRHTSPARQKRGSGEIPAVLLDGMDQLEVLMMQAFAQDWVGGKLDGRAGVVPEGFAIAKEVIDGYGVGTMETASLFARKGWLYVDEKNRARKLFNVELGGTSVKCLILRAAVARDLNLI